MTLTVYQLTGRDQRWRTWVKKHWFNSRNQKMFNYAFACWYDEGWIYQRSYRWSCTAAAILPAKCLSKWMEAWKVWRRVRTWNASS
jgi:hypothetical protein